MATSVKLSNGNYIDSAGIWDATSKKSLETALSILLADGAGAHNSLYRGKYLGTTVTTAQWAAIKAGTFTDLYIGDYWTINSVNYRIAAFDYYLNSGSPLTTAHHVVMVPDTNLYAAQMNTTATTEGGYANSAMYTSNLENAKTTIKAAFSGHVLSHAVPLTTATSNGRASVNAWYSVDVDLMTEQMVYGSGVFNPVSNGSSIPRNYSNEISQLRLFALDKSKLRSEDNWWLKNILSATQFSYVSYFGVAACDFTAERNSGVRPAFCIYQS